MMSNSHAKSNKREQSDQERSAWDCVLSNRHGGSVWRLPGSNPDLVIPKQFVSVPDVPAPGLSGTSGTADMCHDHLSDRWSAANVRWNRRTQPQPFAVTGRPLDIVGVWWCGDRVLKGTGLRVTQCRGRRANHHGAAQLHTTRRRHSQTYAAAHRREAHASQSVFTFPEPGTHKPDSRFYGLAYFNQSLSLAPR